MEIQAGLGKTQYGCIPMAPHTSWEWLEQYGAVQATPGHLDKTHKERADELTSYVLEAGIPGKLEEKLKATASMAKKRGEGRHHRKRLRFHERSQPSGGPSEIRRIHQSP